jgi:cell division protease FtsH
MKNFFLFSIIICAFNTGDSLIQRTIKMSLNSNKIPNEIYKYKSVFQPESLGGLIQDIDSDKVENVYFTEDMKIAYAKHKSNVNLQDDDSFESGINDYTTISTSPAIANSVIEHANAKKVNTVIMVAPTNPFNQIVPQITNIFDFIFIPTMLYFLFRAIYIQFNGFGRGSGGMPPMGGPMGGPGPFNTIGGRSQSDIIKENMEKSNITLNSWAGSPEIFQECTEVVSYLNNKTMYEAAGAKIPKGILLEGPPGTGKTLIAKAIASEANANFFAVASSEFVELFVGMGAAKVRGLFKAARENAPSIIFIDEIDAVGKQRGTGINMGNDEREQTLNQLLAEMDGFAQNEGVLVIAATNRRDVLDKALLRPGRFDRIINVPLPDRESRKSILDVHLNNKKIEDGVSLEMLSDLTAGFSGAQLQNLANEAAINAVRLGKTVISQKNLEDALEKLIVGIIKQNDTRSDITLQRVAIHEIGHAFLAAYFDDYFELKKVSIQSTYNGAGGYTIFSEYPEIIEGGLYTKDLLKKRIIVALGGKAAETIFYGNSHVSLGATQDLKQANSIAQQMVGNYGMGDKDLEVFYNENTESDRNPFLGRTLGMGDKYSEKTKEQFDREVLEIINYAFKEALSILSENRHKLNILVNILECSTILSGEFVRDYIFQKSNHTTTEEHSY